MQRLLTELWQPSYPMPEALQHATLLLTLKTTQLHAKRKNKQFSSADLEDATRYFTLWQFHREPLAWSSCTEPSKAFGNSRWC